ncbi:NAD-dependent epimerase/dehydratase family protein [Planctomycetota bacterium]|nr:NAD-dependent epimerase/dehydratase family protein [Planctomycetota bacterium]
MKNTQSQIVDVDRLEEVLSEPTGRVLEMFSRTDSDLIILGIGGKMGPTLGRMAVRAMEQVGSNRKVIGVSRFSDPAMRERLESWGIKTIAGDLLDDKFVNTLPKTELMVYMAGMKFGATGNESLTWAMNTLLPARACQRYKDSRIAAFSTGNVYGLVPVASGGSLEGDSLNPCGEYAMSCLGRERTLEYYCKTNQTKLSILRLNYACELRYGVLVDIASKIWRNESIDLGMPMANVIWQRDANAMALLSLMDADVPPYLLNIAGPEQLSVKKIAMRLGGLLHKDVVFSGEEGFEAILSNGQMGHRRYGYPTLSIDELMIHISDWIQRDGDLLGKPTKYELRSGKF